MSKKLITTLEKERGIIIVGNIDLKAKYTDEEFDALTEKRANDIVGVDHQFRVEWLKDNGYKVTRKNMINLSLAPKIEESEKNNSDTEQIDVG